MIVFNPWPNPGAPGPNPGGSILDAILELLCGGKTKTPPSK